MEKLKPCPFCGDDKPYVYQSLTRAGRVSAVNCSKCGARGAQKKKAEDAVELWNHRICEQAAYDKGFDEGWSASEKNGRDYYGW